MLARGSSLPILVLLGHLPMDWKHAAKKASRLQKTLRPVFPQNQVQDEKRGHHVSPNHVPPLCSAALVPTALNLASGAPP
jgi:hypothetical protein